MPRSGCITSSIGRSGTLIVFGLVLFLTSISHAQQAFVDGVDLTTLKAPWIMRILGNDLALNNVQAKPDERSAYYMLSSASTKLNVSVFIEPVSKCKTSDECRDHVLAVGNPAWGQYQGLTKGKLKDFSYFVFFRSVVRNGPLRVLDMYAEHVVDGYWIDVHISKVDYSKVDRQMIEKVINSTTFVPKPSAGSSAYTGLDGRGCCQLVVHSLGQQKMS